MLAVDCDEFWEEEVGRENMEPQQSEKIDFQKQIFKLQDY